MIGGVHIQGFYSLVSRNASCKVVGKLLTDDRITQITNPIANMTYYG